MILWYTRYVSRHWIEGENVSLSCNLRVIAGTTASFSRDFHSLRTTRHSGVIKKLQVVVCNCVQALLCALRNSDMTLLIMLWHGRTGCNVLLLSPTGLSVASGKRLGLKFLQQSAGRSSNNQFPTRCRHRWIDILLIIIFILYNAASNLLVNWYDDKA